ncbi:MAG: HYR domain protein [Nitrosopumilales archaeon]|nr:MAG: HYR domain protein [Nitrosopumilales archaeon]
MKGIVSLVLLAGILLAGTVTASTAYSASHPLLTQWGESGTSSGSFYSPQNLAIDSDGNVYVTDLGNKRVQKFDNDGTFLSAWGSGGTGAGQFNSPSGISVYENFVYVVDSQLNKIQKFDTDGNFVTQWGSSGDEPGQFLLPKDITVNKNGTLLVVDTGNQRIQQFSIEGEFLKEFGQSGSGDEEFVSPTGITTDDDYNIYVSDPGSNSIKKFDSEGNLIKIFGPNIAGFPIKPGGLVIDPEGNIYVADTYNNRILRLDPEGTTLTTFGSMGIEDGQFKFPMDVALDQNANLFVTDSNGHRIQKFDTPIIVDVPQSVEEETLNTTNTTEENQIIETTPIPGDLTRPTIIPPNDLIIEATGGLTHVSVGQAVASDESGIQSLTTNAPSEFPLGITTIIWTAIDGSGNMAVATQTITVSDTTPPTISTLENITVEASNPTQNLVNLKQPIVTDAVGVMSIENDSPGVFPIGETIVTWTGTDVMGNIATTTQKIIVIDTKNPTLYAPDNIVVEATSLAQNEIYIGEASVIDNGEIVSVINDAPEFFSIGNTTIIWIAIDSSANTVNSTQIVSVVDTTAPEIIPPENIVVEATSTSNNIVNLDLPQTTDIQQVTIINDAPGVYPIGGTLVTWTATDESGNFAITTQLIIVIDSTPPSITITEKIVAEAIGPDNIISLGEIVIEDISEIASVSNDAPETFSLGITVVTWTVIDSHGNIAITEQNISIIDTTPPEISPPKDIVIEAIDQNGNFVDLGAAKVYDIVGIASLTNDSPVSFPIGMTSVTWTVSDTSGNIASATQVITVEDTTSPEIISPDNITIESTGSGGTLVSIGDAIVSDIIVVSSVTNDAPETFQLGETTVTWTATDTHGNVATDTQLINVVDTTPPSIIPPTNVVVEAMDPFSNPADIGMPEVSDLVSIVIFANDSPESFPVGDTIITWTAIDVAGNTASATQTVSVVDTTSPKLSIPQAITVEATSQYGNLIDYGSATASDEVGVTSIVNDAPETFPSGLTSIIWIATDAAGNTASATQTVSVVDTTSPEIIPPDNIVQEAQSRLNNVVLIGEAQATDAVSIGTISNDAPSVFQLGETIVTWFTTDLSNNIANATQIITIVDTTSPTIAATEDITVEATSANENQVLLEPPSSHDIVSDITITNDAPQFFSLGETVVTWTATDESGNSVSNTQTITIVDATPPELVVPEDVIVNATGFLTIASIGQAVSTDLTDPSPTVSNNAPEIFPLGQTLVTWTSLDTFGNSVTNTQQIEVQACGKPISYYNMIEGSFDDDFIEGTSHPDLIFGYGGDDIIIGAKGNDCIFGGEGDDIIFGNEGNDNLTGGEGNDIIKGNVGDDIITGGTGIDVIDGGDDNDTCVDSQNSDDDMVVKCEIR